MTGVTIKDIDKIPTDASKLGPVMYPIPNGFVTDMVFERSTLGSGGTAKMDLSYTLNYRLLYAKVGSGLGTMAAYDGLITSLAAILVAIFTNDTLSGALDIQLQSVSNIGPLTDLSEQNTYHGVDIALRVQEITQ